MHSSCSSATLLFNRLRHLYRIELHDIHHKFDAETVVDFLTSHSQTYDTIREVKIGGPNDVGKSTAPGVVRILSCLRKVKVLDMTEWREAIKYLDMIPTQHLETLLLGNVRMTVNSQAEDHQNDSEDEQQQDEHKEDPQTWALQHCRRLKEVRMPVLVEGLFEWAVQERQTRLGSFSRPPLSWCSPSPAQPYWIDGPSPVQLENIHLSGSSTGPLISTLLHVVDAFRDSLKVLQSTSWIDSTETGSCGLSLAWSWRLPSLQVLDLQGEIAYRFRILSLESCPQLRVLRLTLPHSFLPLPSSSSSSVSPTTTGSSAGPGTTVLAEHEVSAALSSGPSSSSSSPTPPLSTGLCACCRRDQRQGQQQQQRVLLADVLGNNYDDDDKEDSYCTCVSASNSNNNSNSNSSSSTNSPHHHYPQHRDLLFPRLEEFKLVGDWGLTDESLLGIAKRMPRLKRLSLLRCESDKLTALGLIRAMPSLRGQGLDRGRGRGRVTRREGDCAEGEEVCSVDVGDRREEPSNVGGSSCRVRWMEVCKSWQCEIKAALEYENDKSLDYDDDDDDDCSKDRELYLAFAAAVNGGVCPLQIEYQY
ncbi:hypothetical protein BGX33_000960 [Mortierella sp. NVP41]|nr:hypothetical protein BGX33_000960 [Mortierella sp. NVP41]